MFLGKQWARTFMTMWRTKLQTRARDACVCCRLGALHICTQLKSIVQYWSCEACVHLSLPSPPSTHHARACCACRRQWKGTTGVPSSTARHRRQLTPPQRPLRCRRIRRRRRRMMALQQPAPAAARVTEVGQAAAAGQRRHRHRRKSSPRSCAPARIAARAPLRPCRSR